MHFQRVAPADIPDLWDFMADVLRPSLAFDAQRTKASTLAELVSGELQAWIITGDAAGVVLSTLGTVVGAETCAFWIVHAGGGVAGGPKQRCRALRAAVAGFEVLAARLDADEIRIEGRVSAWGRVLPEYELSDGILRKVL